MTEQPTPHAFRFTEAPASWNVKYLESGYDCQLTLRDDDTKKLLERISNVMDWLDKTGAQPTRVSAPAIAQAVPAVPPPASSSKEPTMVPVGDEDATVHREVIQVNTIQHAVTNKGLHHLTVLGGKFSKFGVACWDECIPDILKGEAGYTKWEFGTVYKPPAGMEYATVEEVTKNDTTRRKVVAWSSHA